MFAKVLQLELSHAGTGMQSGAATVENSWAVSCGHRTHDLASNSLSRHLLKRKQVHEGLTLTCSPQHSHPKLETQPPATVNGHPHGVLLLSNEKEQTTDGAMGASQRVLGEERRQSACGDSIRTVSWEDGTQGRSSWAGQG